MAGYEEKSVQFRADDFQLIQQDIRIMDTKLDTKPTTFFRDAVRRFRKNKSSVVAAIILAILILLAILVPMLSPHNITNVSTTEGFLAPKLFEAGTGFWDGTRSKTRIVYDTVNEVPALSDRYSPAAIKQSLISLTVDQDPTYIDAASAYGSGGVSPKLRSSPAPAATGWTWSSPTKRASPIPGWASIPSTCATARGRRSGS